MSLEIAIQELNTNVKALIDAISKGVPVAASTVATVSKAAEAADKAATKKPDAKTVSSQPGAKPESGAPKEDAPASDDEQVEAVAYETVKAKILTLSKEKGREPTMALLARHGVGKGPDLKPEQFAQFVKDVDAILAGTYDPEAAELA